MSNKSFAVGTVVVLVCVVMVTLLAELFFTLQSINPVATAASVAVAVVGVAWFKKTSKH